MNKIAPIGDNNPPSAIEDFSRQIENHAMEVENWLDGKKVENLEQMKIVDLLIKETKAFDNLAKDAKDAEYRPHKTAGDLVISEWKPMLVDIANQKAGLLAILNDFKVAEKARTDAIAAKAAEEAEALRIAAEEAHKAADVGNIHEVREAEALLNQSAVAAKSAKRAGRETTKGLRTYTTHEITDQKACINWIVQNDRQAMVDFMEEYVRRQFVQQNYDIDGVTKHVEKRAV